MVGTIPVIPTVRAAIIGIAYGILMQNKSGVQITRNPVLGASRKYIKYTTKITNMAIIDSSRDNPSK